MRNEEIYLSINTGKVFAVNEWQNQLQNSYIDEKWLIILIDMEWKPYSISNWEVWKKHI